MPSRLIENKQLRTRPWVSFLLFVVFVSAMGYFRLHLLSGRVITLTYGLPLLVCLWYPSTLLLWSMSSAFIVMAAFKAFVVLPSAAPESGNHTLVWAMQVANILVIAAAVHIVMRLLTSLQEKNRLLSHTNDELLQRDEAISLQNEELQAQGEELTRQNEEIEQQAEELQQQRDELEVQSAELQSANAELAQRQFALERMLHALHSGPDGGSAPQQVCEAALQLLAADATAAAVLLRDGEQFVIRGAAGAIGSLQPPLPLSHTLAAVVVQHRRPAGISDLSQRPDIQVPAPVAAPFRAILAAPLWLGGEPAGALEFYADRPHEWTREHFAVVEWGAAQCSLILEARRLRDELREANTVLEGQVHSRTHELQDLVNELEHFSYTITHDLRAPLRAMQGYAGILEEEYLNCLDETGRSYLRRIIIAATRMDQLITDALSYSRAVRQELAMVPVDPAMLLRNMLDSYPQFQRPNAVVEIDDSLPLVLANEAGLTQCFSNLLGNAVKFVAPGTQPHVRVRAEPRDGMVRLWCEDNGIGIAPHLQSRLFNMFQRLSREYEGTGIGLALVRKVAERMGGQVGVESELGRGSRFWLELRPARPSSP